MGGLLDSIRWALRGLSRIATVDYPAVPDSEYSEVEYIRGRPVLDPDKCTACGACASDCPSDAIEVGIDDEGAYRKYFVDRCMFCGRCIDVCPEGALKSSNEHIHVHGAGEEPVDIYRFETVKCLECGRPFAVPLFLKVVGERLGENLDESVRELVLVDYRHYSRICPDCKIKLNLKVHPGKYMVVG